MFSKQLKSVIKVKNVCKFDGKRCLNQLADNVVTSPLGVITVPDHVTVSQFVYDRIKPWGDRTAIECGLTGRKYSYVQLIDNSTRLAAAFQHKFGLVQNDCIATVLPNLPEVPLIYLAGSEAGLITTTVNPIYTPGEISRQLKHAHTKLIITTPRQFQTVADSVALVQQNIPIIVIQDSPDSTIPEGAINFEELQDDSLKGKFKQTKVEQSSVFVLPYSSGTTGLPKGVQLTHHNIVANLIQDLNPQVKFVRDTTANFQETVSGILPFFHIFGMSVVLLGSLINGSKVVTLPHFDKKGFVTYLAKYQPSVLYVVPPLVLLLGDDKLDSKYLSQVRRILSGAAPCGEKDIERVRVKCHKDTIIAQGYGLTETSPIVFKPLLSRVKSTSVGIPVASTQIRVVDVNSGKNLSVGEKGEIFIKGPQVMRGYFQNEEANREVFEEQGYFKTGDIGYYDENSDFYIVDRLKELIKVKGFQVAPAELEELLRSHPQIADAAVIGVEDSKHGEAPKAFVVRKPGASLTSSDIQNFVAKEVAYYKQLTGGVQFLEAIPKSSAGKILRKELKEIK